MFLTGIGSFMSQNLKEDVAEINNAYKKQTKLSFVMELNMFENYITNKVYYTQSGVIKKNGNSTFQSFDDTECIITSEYSVMFDKDDKEIVYAPKKQASAPAVVALNLDSVLRFCKSNKFIKVSSNLYSYDFVMIDGYPDYNRITVYFNPSDYLIQKIVFYCEADDISLNNDDTKIAKSRIEINYKNIETKPVYTNSDFTYEKYLVKSGNKFSVKPLFKEYHLTVLSF